VKTLTTLIAMLSLAASAAEFKPLSKDFFGVRLGMSVSEFNGRCSSAGLIQDRESLAFKDPDYPCMITVIPGSLNTNASVKATHAYIYKDAVCMISVIFTDNSESNFDVICESLAKKYTPSKQTQLEMLRGRDYETRIDGINILIKAARKTAGWDGEDKVSVDYIRADALEAVFSETSRLKADKVADGL